MPRIKFHRAGGSRSVNQRHLDTIDLTLTDRGQRLWILHAIVAAASCLREITNKRLWSVASKRNRRNLNARLFEFANGCIRWAARGAAGYEQQHFEFDVRAIHGVERLVHRSVNVAHARNSESP